ncbi:MAG: AgmX/PglI C-terminal domain-containing protein [Myxococcales bacterium]|nr:AgmX/PglI C-terminal domain-containing protein [Myxococcales bacterium]
MPATVALPQVGRGAFLDAVPAGPLVVAGDTEIVLEGSSLVPLRNGAVPASELAGTATDLRLPKVVAWAAAWHQLPIARDAVVSLAVKPSHPAAVALQVIASFAPSEQREFALLARGSEGVGALPVRLPAAAAPSAPAPAEPPVDMVLSFAGPDLLVWSLSGQEGTLAAPRAVLPVDADGAWVERVREVLGAVVQRRWAGRARPVDQTAIVIMVDPPSTAGALVAAIAAVRSDATGRPLFPDVRLSLGFAPVAKPAAATAPPAVAHDDTILTQLTDDEAARFAQALLASSDDDMGAGDMARRRPGSDLGSQIDDVRAAGAAVAVGGGTRQGTSDGGRGDGDPRVGGGTMRPGGDGPAPAAGPVPGITITSKAQVTDTSLSTDEVLRKLTAVYMSGLKRCYGEALKLDPQQRGAVTLAFTLNETGRVTDAKVGAMTPALTACIEGAAANWRFPVPRDGDGEPAAAEFKLGLGLAPR